MRMRVLMIATTCVAAAWLTTTSLMPSRAQAQSWSKYAGADDRFEAEFLGKVAKEPVAVGSSAKALGLSRSTISDAPTTGRLPWRSRGGACESQVARGRLRRVQMPARP